MEQRIHLALLITALLAMLAGCDSQKPDAPSAVKPEPVSAHYREAEDASKQLWLLGLNALGDIRTSDQALHAAIAELIANPTEESLVAARSSWRASEEVYQKFYFFTQFGVTEPEIFAPIARANFAIAAHPIQPGYLDYFGPYPYSGLVHDISVTLNAENLINQHGMTDPEDVVLGLYAIEFMLFGEKGARPIDDYKKTSTLTLEQKQRGFKSIEETPNNRRRELLQLQSTLLIDGVNTLIEEWQSQKATAVFPRWQTLPDSARRLTVRKTFERSLTKLLLQTASASSPSEDGKAANRIDPALLAISIASLQAAYPWLEPDSRKTIKDNLQSAHAQLSATERAPDTLQQGYRALKMAMDTYLNHNS
ncbi:imelysin family protein [Teredinibacter franksiae]|uniref:imelysin family protein n=1 Tax=Teredinibacter franksiae TaxID=2761453 RepID=UPI0016287103|nr:imelysin family protein [Teredinibacter franksiae]